MSVSALVGALFGALLGPQVTSGAGGLVRGFAFPTAWWLIGPTMLLSAFVGTGLNVNFSSLALHLLYGSVLGMAFAWWKTRSASEEPSAA